MNKEHFYNCLKFLYQLSFPNLTANSAYKCFLPFNLFLFFKELFYLTVLFFLIYYFLPICMLITSFLTYFIVLFSLLQFN